MILVLIYRWVGVRLESLGCIIVCAASLFVILSDELNGAQLGLSVNYAIQVHVNSYKNEPAHDKTYNKTWTGSKDSVQPAHPRSLIKVFADNMCLQQPPKMDE